MLKLLFLTRNMGDAHAIAIETDSTLNWWANHILQGVSLSLSSYHKEGEEARASRIRSLISTR